RLGPAARHRHEEARGRVRRRRRVRAVVGGGRAARGEEEGEAAEQGGGGAGAGHGRLRAGSTRELCAVTAPRADHGPKGGTRRRAGPGNRDQPTTLGGARAGGPGAAGVGRYVLELPDARFGYLAHDQY